ncbi:MAG: DUF2892 domain-containing protein [Gammaproteobacteria bacterium]|nr:DUF2892 domain-containing protein [Gammaproteobacteria bacterium]MDH5799899.1 DUF2892 domain-containing protein [Gammaproteobacteria bacterium]
MIKFRRNMNSLDRLFRATVGATLLAIGPVFQLLTNDMLSLAILGVIGSVAVLSAVFSYCFLYEVTGFSTRSENL